jgi:hypothetical protein
MINIAKELSANAMVIDVKDEFGQITCDLGFEQDNFRIRDIKQVIKTLKQNGIYPIARIVAFRDPLRAISMPKMAVKDKSGRIITDKEGMIWLNPYKKENWQYLADIAKAAVHAGFLEIQFDYVRFSAYKNDDADYGKSPETISRTEIVCQFFDFTMKELKPLGVKVSADVFGCVIPETLGQDTIISKERLGQDYARLCEKLDVICPMIYPSHWPKDSMGIEYPDLEPYKTVYSALEKAVKLKKSKAVTRPWLQAFTAKWLKKAHQEYCIDQINQQKQAAYNAGVTEWCLWNPRADYKAAIQSKKSRQK